MGPRNDSSVTGTKQATAAAIMDRARELGADLVGIASVEDLRRAPAFTSQPQASGRMVIDGARSVDGEQRSGRVTWPARARSVVVIGVHHPLHKPELDWWYGLRDPPGNRLLRGIIADLCSWLTAVHRVGVFHLPYHIEKGGIYLKDAAAWAGLGCIGKNNMLVSPEYGPRIRLRALTLDIEVPSTGPVSFDPCHHCDQRCRKACLQNCFEPIDHSGKEYRRCTLPGRDGFYSRESCNRQMEFDVEMALGNEGTDIEPSLTPTKFCRRCELSCPVGITSD